MSETKPLRVLILEDDPADAELCLRQLHRGGFDVTADILSTPEEFAAKLDSATYDLIISDYNMRSWTGLEALRQLKKTGIDLPFILSTGTIGEEAAVECILEGAADYVLKDRLARLGHAVKRVLEEKALRAEQARAQELLRLESQRLRRSEENLLQVQKMDAIGKLAGGIAHDFNNILGVIAGYAQLLQERLPAEPRLTTPVEQIRKASDRAISLTRQLLAFSRKQVLDPRIMNLNSLITDLEPMLQRIIGEDLVLESVLDPDLGQIRADAGQMGQIIMNLAANARDALPQGGRVIIETSNAELDAGYAFLHPVVVPGHFVRLTFSDTGTGMDEETRARIFEPFFTTKKEGTGLGLATAYGIVKQSGGYIWVYSEVGHGTTFKIYLPLIMEPEEVEKPKPSRTKDTMGSETVLLVEDFDQLRELARDFLAKSGYTVLPAKDGAEAVGIARSYDGPIQMLLTDVVMPGMSGREVARAVALLRSDIKVLYMSGYSENAIVHHGVIDPGTLLLAKPFSSDTLLEKVRQALQGEPIARA